jgi:hypothetical protein
LAMLLLSLCFGFSIEIIYVLVAGYLFSHFLKHILSYTV